MEKLWHHLNISASGSMYYYTKRGVIRVADHPQYTFKARRPVVLDLRIYDKDWKRKFVDFVKKGVKHG